MRIGRFDSVGQKLLSGSVLRMGNLLASAVSATLLTPFIVHHLGDRLYGFWSLAAAFIGYYCLLDLGLSSAVTQYIGIAIGRNNASECKAVFNTALRIQSVLGGVALLATATIAAATPWLCHNPADTHLFRQVIAIIGVSAALGFPTRVYWSLLEAELRFDIQSWLDLLQLLLRSGLIFFVIKAGGGLLALAWVTLIASLPPLVLRVWYASCGSPWARISNHSLDLRRTRSFFSFSIYTFIAVIADVLRFQIDVLVISSFIGLAAVTHYKIASVFTSYYIAGLIALASVFQPLMSRLYGADDQRGLEKVFFFATKVTVFAAVFICFVCIAWGRPFIARWMGPQYQDAFWPMVALSVAVFLDGCQCPSIGLLQATFKHRFYAYINLTEGLLNLLFSLLLVRVFGILGVALGTLAGAVVIRVVAQPLVVCRVSKLSYRAYVRFLGDTLLRYAFLMAVATVIVMWALRPAYVWLIGSGLVASSVYVTGSWLFAFNQREREQLLRALRRSDNRRHLEPTSATEVLV